MVPSNPLIADGRNRPSTLRGIETRKVEVTEFDVGRNRPSTLRGIETCSSGGCQDSCRLEVSFHGMLSMVLVSDRPRPAGTAAGPCPWSWPSRRARQSRSRADDWLEKKRGALVAIRTVSRFRFPRWGQGNGNVRGNVHVQASSTSSHPGPSACLSPHAEAAAVFFSGLRVTVSIGSQLRIEPDQREGLRRRARS